MNNCKKQHRYDTQWRAELHRRAIARKAVTSGKKPPGGTHFCSACRGWHLTSRRPSQRPPWD